MFAFMAKKDNYDIDAAEIEAFKALYRTGDLGLILKTMPEKWRVSEQTLRVFLRSGETRSPRLATYVRRFYAKRRSKL